MMNVHGVVAFAVGIASLGDVVRAAVAPAFVGSVLPSVQLSQSQSSPVSILSTLRMSSASSDSPSTVASDLLYKEQERLLVERGKYEENLMAQPPSSSSARVDTATRPPRPLQPNTVKVRGTGKSGGFGGGSDTKTASTRTTLKTEAKSHAKVLKRDGVVRIDDVLSADIADNLRAHLYNLRKTAEHEVSTGAVAQSQRFADVLLRKDRCDLTVPVGDELVSQALMEALCNSSVGQTIETIFSNNAVLHELSCLMSDPGSQRQVLHPDTPFLEGQGPVLYTCFIALQDIRLDMGPTVWLPGTHTMKAHEEFKDDNPSADGESRKDRLIRTSLPVMGTLPKGCCAIFDSRCLHCGTANTSESDSRALFYFSFKTPSVGYPGNPASIRPEIGSAKVTLGQLAADLESYRQDNGHPFIDNLAAKLK